MRAIEEVVAIAALGQGIGGGQALQLGFHVLFVGDVFGEADDDHRLARLCLAVDEAFVAEPAHLALGVDDAVFAVLDGAFVQHLRQAALGVFQVVGINAVAPLVVVGQQQVGGSAENPFIGGADVQHLAGFPIEGPKHRVDAHQQGAEQLLAFAQARHFTLGTHQRHQGLRGLGPLRWSTVFQVFIDHRYKSQRACTALSSKRPQRSTPGWRSVFERGDLQRSSERCAPEKGAPINGIRQR
ncbi:hypothetical protein D3C71_1067820 [compost metagenome]